MTKFNPLMKSLSRRFTLKSHSVELKGEEIEVKHNAVGPAVARRHRRDFCANPVIDRGIALRQNLGLPVPDTASTLIHGLTPSVSYHFTVSCVAAPVTADVAAVRQLALALGAVGVKERPFLE